MDRPIPFAFSRDPYGVLFFKNLGTTQKPGGIVTLLLLHTHLKFSLIFFFPCENLGTTPKAEDTATHTATHSATHTATHTKESGSTG